MILSITQDKRGELQCRSDICFFAWRILRAAARDTRMGSSAAGCGVFAVGGTAAGAPADAFAGIGTTGATAAGALAPTGTFAEAFDGAEAEPGTVAAHSRAVATAAGAVLLGQHYDF